MFSLEEPSILTNLPYSHSAYFWSQLHHHLEKSLLGALCLGPVYEASQLYTLHHGFLGDLFPSSLQLQPSGPHQLGENPAEDCLCWMPEGGPLQEILQGSEYQISHAPQGGDREPCWELSWGHTKCHQCSTVCMPERYVTTWIVEHMLYYPWSQSCSCSEKV